jgi:hexosaminidase
MKGSYKRLVLLIIICLQINITQANLLNVYITPIPDKVEIGKGFCNNSKELSPYMNSKMMPYAAWLAHINAKSILTKEASFANNGISDFMNPALQNYNVSITEKDINVDGFMGYQTLYQLYEQFGEKLPCMNISDKFDYVYRGIHLDVSRHFYNVLQVKKYLDLLARYRYNVFHWHLTDDQGWRIQIKKYPKLTSIGSTRSGTIIGKQITQDGKPNSYDTKTVSGFYTQAQIKEVIQYATELGILVIPEIEMPGHSKAAIASYPFLGCTQEATQVGTRWGVFDDVFCAGQDKTFEFINDVLKEVSQLFPSKYIHIGGDEVMYHNWAKCSNCQARMQAQGLKKEEQLQAYFVRRVQKEILTPLNKRMFGWDELVDDGLDTTAIIMSWRGTEGGIKAAGMGHYVVMTPGTHCYFDHGQSKNKSEPLNIGGNNPSIKVLDFSPLSDNMSTNAQLHTLGAQANCWTEYITTFDQISYMVLPRMIALCEVLCNNGRTRYAEFYTNTQQEFDVLTKADYNYRLLEPPGFSKDTLSTKDLVQYTWQVDASNSITYSFSDKEDEAKPYTSGTDLLPEIKANNTKALYFWISRKGKKGQYWQLFR